MTQSVRSHLPPKTTVVAHGVAACEVDRRSSRLRVAPRVSGLQGGWCCDVLCEVKRFVHSIAPVYNQTTEDFYDGFLVNLLLRQFQSTTHMIHRILLACLKVAQGICHKEGMTRSQHWHSHLF